MEHSKMKRYTCPQCQAKLTETVLTNKVGVTTRKDHCPYCMARVRDEGLEKDLEIRKKAFEHLKKKQ